MKTMTRSARGKPGLLYAMLCAAFLCMPLSAWALKFSAIRDNTVLLVYDCGKIGIEGESEETCATHERSFHGPIRYKNGQSYLGDSAELDRILSQNNQFSKIYLISGGGNLDEGIKVGETLRRYNQFVVVPGKYFCVSACTVAFLGGRLRDVEEGASYKVHAYSSVLVDNSADLEEYTGAEREFELNSFVKRTATRSSDWAKRLVTYAQRMIGGTPNMAAFDSVLSNVPDYHAAYLKSGRLKDDAERIRREGPAAAQEILMRVERETFNVRLDLLKANAASLGPRAPNAIEMLEIMFSSRIAGTYLLDQTTLKEKGYTNVRH